MAEHGALDRSWSGRSVDDAREIAASIRAQVDAGALADALAHAQRELPSTEGLARAIVQHAHALALGSAGRSIDALRAAAAAREGFRTAGARDGELDALLAIGSVLRTADDFASALETFEEAETLARELDDDGRLGLVLRQFGICCSLLGRHQQALSSLREADALHAAQPLGREHLATRLSLYNAHNRSSTSLPADSAERHEGLVEHLALWLGLAEDAARLGQTRTELMALGNHAITLHDCGRQREALQALSALLPRYRSHGMAPNEAICWFEMGRAHQSLGRVRRGSHALRRSDPSLRRGSSEHRSARGARGARRRRGGGGQRS